MNKRVDFLSPLTVIPGFGEKRVEALHHSGIKTVSDFIFNLPQRYVDKSSSTTIANISADVAYPVTLEGEIVEITHPHGNRGVMSAILEDETGSIELIWFNGIRFIKQKIFESALVRVHGTPSIRKNLQVVHPDIDLIKEDCGPLLSFIPRYRLTNAMREAKLSQEKIIQAISWLFKNISHFPEKLPDKLEARYRFPSLKESLKELHFPTDPNQQERWLERIRYEELYQTALHLRWSRKNFELPGVKMPGRDIQSQFLKSLPYSLTPDQKTAITSLYEITSSSKRMHMLLQGDVGCGKTVTAFAATLPVLENGFQVAWITPTAVLAQQTYEEITAWLAPLGITPALLTGSTSLKEKRVIIRGLKTGEISYVVGTHALLQSQVDFKTLRMIVIDEQHRFGVEQRLTLQHKAPAADLLMMSATPIPKTLASTIYRDLDLTTIQYVPSERSTIHTHLVPPQKLNDMEQFIYHRITEHNEQIFWIVPRIESDVDNINDLANTEERLKQLQAGQLKDIPMEVMHGELSPEIRANVLKRFKSGDSKLLIATTVIEVGINIPNATVIVIENGERFGLAQLHQLRGRVGRSEKQSWAFLLESETISESARNRLSQFIDAKDGFEIAELDLKLRNAGEIAGVRQSGYSELQHCDIIRDFKLFEQVVSDINTLMKL